MVPLKEKRQVIELYVELVVEMTMQLGQSGNQSTVAINKLVNDNCGIPLENPTMDNMDMSLASLTGNSSMVCACTAVVTGRTSPDNSSPLGSGTGLQPCAEVLSWEVLAAFAGGAKNPNGYGSSSEFANMNNLAQAWSPFLYSAGQASSSQATTWTGQQMGASSSAALALEGAGSQMAWTGDQQGDFIPEQWMDIDDMQ
ncbi:protein REVEILLE 4-like [Panicum miliaceum]|uniref:Protein REVEILLE 4-like n=1 Tax=Panicum miliaceum TaxID=4540 RepID=A0A3L6PJN1_PANMI|nr:protein REVEILLE 4-like [Panicum miliaceum]